MDSHVKEGQLYVQHQKFGKKWKKNWFVLYPASQNGIARLEFYDCSGNSTEKPSTKKLDKKIIRLSECISILPAVTETCPKDNMSAFCVETNDKTHVFAAEKHVSNEWVDKMCEIAFQGGSACLSSSESNVLQELQMAENLIYYSRDEVNEFWVTVQRTEASERCGLLGSYCLKADRDSLIIKEAKSKKDVLVWPYKLLRRYGRDRVMFSFEAGRRCDSGPGNFTFETKQGNEIFMIVENAIREQKAQAEERHQSCPSLDSDCPALQQIRSAIVEGNSRDPDGDSGGSKPGSADGVFNWREGTDAKNLKGRSLPEPPAPVGGTPPRSPMHRGTKGSPILDDQSNLYSEPADSVRLPPSLSDSLYSDPVDSIKPGSTPIPNLRLRPLGDEGGSRQTCNKPEPFYSDIYDRVNVDLAQRTAGLVVERRPAEGGHAEHIYDEPEGHGGAPSSLPSITTVYDETRLESQTWRARGTDDAQLYKPDDYSASSFVKPAQQQPPPTTARPKGPKPLTAPKPTRAPRKEPPPFPPGKVASNLNNNNSSSRSSPTSYSGGGGSGGPVGKHVELYSKESKAPANSWYPIPSLNSPDIIYDNLGNI